MKLLHSNSDSLFAVYIGLLILLFLWKGQNCYQTESVSCPSENIDISWQTRIFERYLEIESVSLFGCVQECMLRKRCKSFNYNMDMNYCELSYVERKDGTRAQSELGMLFIHSDINNFDKNLTGKCKSHGCDFSSKCDLTTGFCQISECGKELSIPNTTLVSYGHHEIGNSVVYRCLLQFKMVSSEDETPPREALLKCDVNGSWSVPKFNCKYSGSDHDALLPEDDLTRYTDETNITTSSPELTTTVKVQPATSCPIDWITKNKHAYCFVQEGTKWTSAKESCNSMGADLVTVGGTTELNWLVDITNTKGLTMNHFWTGGNDRETSGNYVWDVDDSEIPSELLNINQPKSSPGCIYVSIIEKLLYSTTCSEMLNFVCERETHL